MLQITMKIRTIWSIITFLHLHLDDFDSDENICVHEDETDNCKYHFAYGLNPGKVLYVKALAKKECPFKAPVFVIVGGTALLMLLIGIITFLVWKTFIVIKDRREYAKFIEETRAQRFGAVRKNCIQ